MSKLIPTGNSPIDKLLILLNDCLENTKYKDETIFIDNLLPDRKAMSISFNPIPVIKELYINGHGKERYLFSFYIQDRAENKEDIYRLLLHLIEELKKLTITANGVEFGDISTPQLISGSPNGYLYYSVSAEYIYQI